MTIDKTICYSLFSVLTIASSWANAASVIRATVIETTPVYREASSTSEQFGYLPKGKNVSVNPEPKDGFYSITLPRVWKGTQRIWISEKLIRPNTVLVATVITPNTPVFRDADSSSEQLGVIPIGTVVHANPEQKNGFYAIRLRQTWKGTTVVWTATKSVRIDKELASTQGGKFIFRSLQVDGVYLSNATGSTTSTLLEWTPKISFGNFQIGAALGTMPLRSSGKVYFAVEYGIMPSYQIVDQIRISGLLGMQYWSFRGSNFPAVGGFISYQFPHPIVLLMPIPRVHLGFTQFLSQSAATSQIRLGIEIGL